MNSISNTDLVIKYLQSLISNRGIDTQPPAELLDVEGFISMTMQLKSTLKESARAEKEAKEAREHFEIIFNTSPNSTLITRLDDGSIVDINQAFLVLTGYTREEVIGKTTLELNFNNPANRKKMITELGLDGYYENIEMIFHKKNGDEIIGLISAKIIMLGGVLNVVNVVTDITQRKKSEEEITYLNYHDQLTGLYNRRFYEEELKRIDTEKNLPITLIMADVNGLKLINDAFGHLAGDKLIMEIATILKKEFGSRNIVARIGGDEFIILLPKTDSAKAEELVNNINKITASKKIDNTILSAAFGWGTKNEVNEEITEIYMEAEDQMYNFKLTESANMKRETIKTIIKTLHEKNELEQYHSEKVSELCKSIGTVLDLSLDEVKELGIAGLMHDIGKIGIDDKILNKPGELNAQEWIQIKRHPEIGYHILKSSNEFSNISEYVLAHHERIDGKGYPRGLKGEEISLQSKILCIAEAYIAMRTDKIYKVSLDEESAIKELKTNSGLQFDADIARIFVERVLGKDWD